MNVNIIGGSFWVVPFAWQLQLMHNNVRWIRTAYHNINIVPNGNKEVDADIVIVNDPSFASLSDYLNDNNKVVFGYNLLCSKLRDPAFRQSAGNTYQIPFSSDQTSPTDFTLTGLFDGEKFLSPVFLSLSLERIGHNDTGPNFGCTGIAVKAIKTVQVVKNTLFRFSPFLKTIKFRGFIHIDCIVVEAETPTVLIKDADFRFDLPIMFVITSMISNPSIILLLRSLWSKPITYIDCDKAWNIAIPIFTITDKPLRSVLKSYPKDIYPVNVSFRINEEDQPEYIIHETGPAFIAIGRNAIIKAAAHIAGNKLRTHVRIEDRQGFYRSDVAESLFKKLYKLKRLNIV
ncbi:MAG: hypothetical protein QXT63_02210 [Thermoplasmata archaeon]